MPFWRRTFLQGEKLPAAGRGGDILPFRRSAIITFYHTRFGYQKACPAVPFGIFPLHSATHKKFPYKAEKTPVRRQVFFPCKRGILHWIISNPLKEYHEYSFLYLHYIIFICANEICEISLKSKFIPLHFPPYMLF